MTTAVPKIEQPDWNDQQPPYRLDWPEQDALIDALEGGRSRHMIAPVLFGIYTGGREQEIVSLRWDQAVDVEGLPTGSVWWIPPEIRKGNARRRTSEQEGRYLIAGGAARSVIDGQRGINDNWVFPGPKGDRLGRLNNSAWRTAWRRAGLPVDGVRRGVHNLRHTFGTRMEAAGIPWEYRKALLGHEIRDVTALYSAPGLAGLLGQVEKIKRGTACIPRALKIKTTPRRALTL